MTIPIILASGSQIRARLLAGAGIEFTTMSARVDEEAIKASLISEHVSPRDCADALAEAKALKASGRHPDCLVIGCDQTLEFKGTTLSKPASRDALLQQLRDMGGETHKLHSALVICETGRPIWRIVDSVSMQMRQCSDTFLRGYIDRNWDEIRHCVGGYQLEAEGIRLFSAVDGDYFGVLGMPLIKLLNYLAERGVIET